MGAYVFQFSMHLGMTLWVTNPVMKDGVLYKVSKKFFYLLLVCLPVIINKLLVFNCYFIISFNFSCSEPNDESGANVDAAKMWREDREGFNKVAESLVRKTLGIPTSK